MSFKLDLLGLLVLVSFRNSCYAMLVAHVSDKVWSLVTDILSPDHGRQESIDQFETSPYF